MTFHGQKKAVTCFSDAVQMEMLYLAPPRYIHVLFNFYNFLFSPSPTPPPPPKKKHETKSQWIKLAVLISQITILKNHDLRGLAKSRFTRKTKAIFTK